TEDIDSGTIANALQQWRTHRAVPTALPAGAFPVADILADRANLDPRRWNASSTEIIGVQQVRSTVEDLNRAVTHTLQPSKLLATTLHGSDQTPKLVSLTDLEKSGNLIVLRGAEKVREKDYDTEGNAVVTGTWIR